MIETIMDGFTWANFFYFLGLVATFLATTVFVGNAAISAANETINKIIKAIDENSPGGKEITKDEAESIVKSGLNVLWAIISRKFGALRHLFKH